MNARKNNRAMLHLFLLLCPSLLRSGDSMLCCPIRFPTTRHTRERERERRDPEKEKQTNQMKQWRTSGVVAPFSVFFPFFSSCSLLRWASFPLLSSPSFRLSLSFSLCQSPRCGVECVECGSKTKWGLGFHFLIREETRRHQKRCYFWFVFLSHPLIVELATRLPLDRSPVDPRTQKTCRGSESLDTLENVLEKLNVLNGITPSLYMILKLTMKN